MLHFKCISYLMYRISICLYRPLYIGENAVSLSTMSKGSVQVFIHIVVLDKK